jgi:hypothetical protein
MGIGCEVGIATRVNVAVGDTIVAVVARETSVGVGTGVVVTGAIVSVTIAVGGGVLTSFIMG